MFEPSWMQVARSYIGTKEFPGPANNPVIVQWLVQLQSWFKDDAVAWCGSFMAHCMQRAKVTYPKNYPAARSWASWGIAAPNMGPGVVLVFVREGGGHVGLYAGEDAVCYHVLGGNQSDQVSITRIAKQRLIAARWPDRNIYGQPVPFTGKPVVIGANGLPVSANEQ